MFRVVPIACSILMICLGLGNAASKESVLPRLVVRCGGTFNLCGFVDRQTGSEIIPRRYEHALMFSEGLAGVRIDGRYGFVDAAGTLVIAPRFDLVGSFHLGLAEILIGDATGVIDRSGKVVLEPRFARAIPFTKDLILAQEGRSGGGQLRNLNEEFFIDSGFGLFSLRSGWLTKPQFTVREFDNHRGWIWASSDGKLFGLLRSDGAWQVEPRYSEVHPLNEDRAAVCVSDGKPAPGTPPTQLCGAVDADGKLAVPFRSWKLGAWVDGTALMSEGGKSGFVDKDGKIIGGRLFDDAQRSETEGLGKVLLDGKWAGLDRQGRIVAILDDHKVIATCPSGVKLIREADKEQVVGVDGKPTVPYPLDYTHNRLDCDKPSVVRLGDKWGYLGTDGHLLVDPPAFDNQFDFIDGFAGVLKGGKWGFIDTTGHYAVAPRYDELRPAGWLCPINRSQCSVGRGLYKVVEAGRQYWIDATGAEKAEPQVDRAAYLECGDSGARINLVTVSGARLWGIIDPAGRAIIEPRYRAILCFRGGVAWVPDDDKCQWCPVKPDGSRPERPDCVPALVPDGRTDSHSERFSQDPYENSVLHTQAFLEFGAGLRAAPPRWHSDFSKD